MFCPYCHNQISADGSCACDKQANKNSSATPEIRTAGVDGHEAAIRTERLPFRGLELPIP